MASGERAYLELLGKLVDKAGSTLPTRRDRTGTGTYSVFGAQLRFDLRDCKVPALTTKRLAWKACLEELLWFLRGSTDSTELSSSIWKPNTTRAFLDARGLQRLPVGDIGAGYGFQWRHFGAAYATCKQAYDGQGVDQVAEVERLIREDPTSRRIYMTAWNPAALGDMALPPCHVSAQFYVDGRELSCHAVMRSADVFLGLPFNVFSYATLTHVLAKRAGLAARELVLSVGDAHLYADHVEQARLQLSREPFEAPALAVSDAVVGKGIGELVLSDFELLNYRHHPAIAAPMSA
jgi:thymidylate synthase